MYGGGGIMPDYFVPLDRGNALDGYYQVANTAALNQYAFHYTNSHKESLTKAYPNAVSFVSKMTVTDAQISELLRYYQTLSKQQAPTLSAESRKELKVWLKALIGRNLYGNDAFYPVINQSDKTIAKALEVIGDVKTE